MEKWLRPLAAAPAPEKRLKISPNPTALKKTDPVIAEALWPETFPDEERRQIFEMTQKRILGSVSDEEWNAFMRMLENAVSKK